MVRRKSDTSSFSRRSEASSKSVSPSEKSSRTSVVFHRNFPKQRQHHVLKEIKYLRKSTKLLIPKAPFARVVREIINDLFPRLDVKRIQAAALEALQESAEMYLTQFFEDAMLLSLHAKRVTLMLLDLVLLRRLRGRDDIINR